MTPMGLEVKRNWYKHEVHDVHSALHKSSVSESEASCLLPVSMTLWQANLLAYKQGEFSEPSEFLKMVEAILEFGPSDSRALTWNQEFEYHSMSIEGAS